MNDTATDPVALWAEQQVSLLKVKKWPRYGSPAWRALDPADRSRAAAIIEAAELWRRHWLHKDRLARLAEDDPEEWWREVTAEANGEAQRLLRALRLSTVPLWDDVRKRRAQFGPIRDVAATPQWPPVAVPGRPGFWRHCGPAGQQIDLTHNRATE
jgi:hypothetical protein